MERGALTEYNDDNNIIYTTGPMSRLWTQKVELFSPYLIARRDVFYAARASSSTCCGVL